MHIRSLAAAFAASVALPVGAAHATDLEVTHWWTSGGEAAAVAEFAKAFDATGNKWVDGAIAGAGSTARPIMISRITGGDPMAATQFNHGRQAEELVESGLMRDLTDLATSEGWADVVAAPALLESCTLDGKIYCVPVNIHSWQWMWLSNKAFEDAGVPVPTNWEELVAAAPKLREAGKIPLAVGGEPWQQQGVFNVLLNALGGKELTLKVFDEKDAEVAAGPEGREDLRGARPGPRDVAGRQREELERGDQPRDHRRGRCPDHGRLGAGRVPGRRRGRGHRLHLPARPRRQRDHLGRRRRLLLPAARRRGGGEGAGGAGLDDVQPGGAGRLQSEEGIAPDPQGRRPRCGQRLHEEGSRDPRLGEHHQVDRHDAHARIRPRRRTTLFTEFFADTSITPEDAQARFAEIIANAD